MAVHPYELYEEYSIHAQSSAEFYFLIGQAEYGGLEYQIDGNKITFAGIMAYDVDVILENLEFLRGELGNANSPYRYGFEEE